MADAHPNARLEAFSDGVFAIALTLLVIEIRLPAMDSIGSSTELWRALGLLGPTVFAFLLSFAVILITWVNHHGTLRLVDASSAPFMYGNGFLLLTVVFIPFPTALLGAFVRTDHAAPAVVLYVTVLAVQAIGWILLTGAALSGDLACDELAATRLRVQKRSGYFAFALYALLAVAALWIPVTVAIITAVTWMIWLSMSLKQKDT